MSGKRRWLVGVARVALPFGFLFTAMGLIVLIGFCMDVVWDGSISGTVLTGPTCPVLRDYPDENCADKPYATNLVITPHDQPERIIKGFKSDTDGKFKIWVRPGQYTIRSAAATNVLPYCINDEIINVNAKQDTEVTINCDSGIR